MPLESLFGAPGGLLGASWGLLGPSWGPLGGLLGAFKKDVGADGAVFNMISRANKKVSETVAPRGPFFQVKNAILYCVLQYIFDIGLISPKSVLKRRESTTHRGLKPLGRGKGEG